MLYDVNAGAGVSECDVDYSVNVSGSESGACESLATGYYCISHIKTHLLIMTYNM